MTETVVPEPLRVEQWSDGVSAMFWPDGRKTIEVRAAGGDGPFTGFRLDVPAPPRPVDVPRLVIIVAEDREDADPVRDLLAAVGSPPVCVYTEARQIEGLRASDWVILPETPVRLAILAERSAKLSGSKVHYL